MCHIPDLRLFRNVVWFLHFYVRPFHTFIISFMFNNVNNKLPVNSQITNKIHRLWRYICIHIYIYSLSLSPSVRWHWQKCSNSKCTTNTRYLWFEIEKIYNLIIFHIRYLLTSMTNFANFERLFIVDMSTDLRAERYLTVIWSKLVVEPILVQKIKKQN